MFFIILEGIQALLLLAGKSSARKRAGKTKKKLVTKLGQYVLQTFEKGGKTVSFAGEIVMALFQLARGRAYFRFRDFFYFLQNCGADALPIVSLISILVA